jgi:hypothetical protein
MKVPRFVVGQAGSAAKPRAAARAEENVSEPAAAFLTMTVG